MPGAARPGLADVVAVCDLDSTRLAGGKVTVEKLFQKRNAPAPKIGAYGDHRELLARSDVDAVVVTTPDHSHAELALAAVYAGKDVLLQKPVTTTHAENVLLRDAVAATGRIFQLGSQQRSRGPNEQFRKACEFVRSGRVGRLRRVEIGLPTGPTAPDALEQPVPPNLNYDAWPGPTAKVYYTGQRVHSQSDGKSRPGWLRAARRRSRARENFLPTKSGTSTARITSRRHIRATFGRRSRTNSRTGSSSSATKDGSLSAATARTVSDASRSSATPPMPARMRRGI